MSLWPALGRPVGVVGISYEVAKDSMRSSLSGTLPFFHSHWVMSISSLEPPPVKMLSGAGSTTSGAMSRAQLPDAGPPAKHPAGHVTVPVLEMVHPGVLAIQPSTP